MPFPGLWGGLALFVVFAATALAWLIRAQRRRERVFHDGPVLRELGEPAGTPAELARIAAAALAAADRAASAAQEADLAQAAAEADRDEAWAAHGVAVRRLADTTAATGTFPVVSGAVGTQEQREVSRAARAAYRRGEISVDELQAVWQRIGGYDPVWAGRARELARLRADAAAAWRRYELAARVERGAWQRAEVARVAARALAEEAATAAEEARSAR